MKKIFVAFPLIVLLASCSKDESCSYDECAIKAPASEITNVQSYLSSNGITAEQHCSGMFYVIDQQGSGTKPDGCSTISLRYEGRLTNGTVFDSSAKTTPTQFSLSGLVTGFRDGMMQLRPGGKMRMFIPPSLGYGSQTYGPIPGNSIIVFSVELLAVR